MKHAVFCWFVAVVIATGSLVAPSRWSVTLAQDARSSQAVEQAGATCPSREFSVFFKVFSTRSDVQRKFTRFPLEYGVLDQEGDYEFKTKLIERFEDVPLLEDGVIFPDEKQKKKGELRVKVIMRGNFKPGPNADPEEVIKDTESATVTLFVPDTGFRIHYRFRRDSRCWFLYGISDRAI
jgi:hypothetical protein